MWWDRLMPGAHMSRPASVAASASHATDPIPHDGPADRHGHRSRAGTLGIAGFGFGEERCETCIGIVRYIPVSD